MGTTLPTRLAGPGQRTPALAYAVLLPVAALFGVGMAGALYRYQPSLGLTLAGSAALLGALAITLARYDLAVGLGFVLMAVVKVEPAPPDALFAVVMSIALVTGRFDATRVPLSVLAALSAFLVLNLVSAVEAIDPTRAAFFFGITLYLCVFSVWFAGYLRSVRRTRLVVIGYLAAAIGSALLGTLAVTLRFPGSDVLLGYGTRAEGLFKDPNVFGPFLVPAALVVLEEILRPRLLRASALAKYGLFVILVLGVLFSYSRAAWLNLVVGAVVMLVVLSLRRRSGRGALGLLVTLAVAASVVVVTVSFTSSASFLQERARRQHYDTQRFGAQRLGVQYGSEQVVGIGPGQFEVLAPVATHSTYVRVLAEQGLAGFVTIAALFLATLAFAMRNAALGRDTYGIGSAALLGAWCGILANSVVVDTLHWRHLWIVAAMIWAGVRRR
jgi:O-antigen ligase